MIVYHAVNNEGLLVDYSKGTFEYIRDNHNIICDLRVELKTHTTLVKLMKDLKRMGFKKHAIYSRL